MSILCFGSANIDDTYRVPHMVARGETLAATSVVRCAGGKGLNQAIALARAASGRLDVAFAGCVGADGAFLLGELEAAGVDVARVQVLEDERTGLAVRRLVDNLVHQINLVLQHHHVAGPIKRQRAANQLGRHTAVGATV